jgi:hypothetical protein
MDIRKAIHELRQEQECLDAFIAALEARQTDHRGRRGRKSVPPEERAQMSKRMTALWAARRERHAATVEMVVEDQTPFEESESSNQVDPVPRSEDGTSGSSEEITAVPIGCRRNSVSNMSFFDHSPCGPL